MELFRRTTIGTLPPDSPEEINERLRRRYLDRLSQRVKRLRKLLVERNWEDLRAECGQLASSGENFGFPSITHFAFAAHEAIPIGKISRAATPLQAKEATEGLISAVDAILMDHAVYRA